MKVLISSIGSNTSISVIKALRFSSVVDLFIVGTDLNPVWFCAGAGMVDRFYQIPSAKEPEKYEAALMNLVDLEKIDCVIGIHDLEIELIARLKEKKPDETFWAVNTPEIIALCNDKRLANGFCSENGIKTPEGFSRSAFDKIAEKDFPLIAKPVRGVSSSGIIRINSKPELERFLINHPGDEHLIQKLVSGDEYTVDCYRCYHGGFHGAVARKRIETKAGISVKGQIAKKEELINQCATILEKMNYRGAANIQFIEHDNTPYFIEINPRFSGGGILSYKAGFNAPLYTVLEAAGKTGEDFPPLNIHYGMIMSRYWEEQFCDAEGHFI